MLMSVSVSSLEPVQKLSLCGAYNVQTNGANVLNSNRLHVEPTVSRPMGQMF